MNWQYDFDDGLQKAKLENQVLLMYFYADWCGWCTKLVQETFDNRQITSFLNEHFVSLKVDIDQNSSLAETYHNEIVPTTVFISSNREELGRIEGYLSPEQFLEYAKTILKKYGASKR
jgi:thioredoxin-related protein